MAYRQRMSLMIPFLRETAAEKCRGFPYEIHDKSPFLQLNMVHYLAMPVVPFRSAG